MLLDDLICQIKTFLKVDSWVELRSIEFPLVKQHKMYDSVAVLYLVDLQESQRVTGSS